MPLITKPLRVAVNDREKLLAESKLNNPHSALRCVARILKDVLDDSAGGRKVHRLDRVDAAAIEVAWAVAEANAVPS